MANNERSKRSLAARIAAGEVRLAANALDEMLGEPLTFGLALRSFRQCEEMTQQQYAAKLGVTKAALSDIERSRKGVSVERAARWGRILGYGEALFVRLALQDEVRRAGLKYTVKLEAA